MRTCYRCGGRDAASVGRWNIICRTSWRYLSPQSNSRISTLAWLSPSYMKCLQKGRSLRPLPPNRNRRRRLPSGIARSAAEVSAGSDLATKVVAAFGEFNLSVEAVGVVEGPQVRRIKLKPVPGVKVASLMTRAADLRVKLALDATPLIEASKGFVAIDLPRADRQTLVLHD